MKEAWKEAFETTINRLMAKLKSDATGMTVKELAQVAWLTGEFSFTLGLGEYDIEFEIKRKEPSE